MIFDEVGKYTQNMKWPGRGEEASDAMLEVIG
jgi:hypothetical protein